MSGLVTLRKPQVRAYLSPSMLPTNECWLGTTFWGAVLVTSDAGIVGTEFVSPAVSASLGVSFNVATVGAFDMDSGRER